MRTVVFGGQGDPAFDPKLPSAYPVAGPAGLLGEMPVRLRAEGELLVAYGFGGQRVQIPARSIRQVWIHREFDPRRAPGQPVPGGPPPRPRRLHQGSRLMAAA